ncbi:MAG TPA: hypothetical protein VFP84_20720, partial [Kofleriaceae bacterium]|nr:hypothetical protein [Kofleriaceae bacterium]
VAPRPTAPAPAAPAAPRPLHATLEVTDIDGSLPHGDIARAVNRLAPSIARCLPAAPITLFAHFTIGEARRAQGVRVVGPANTITGCLTAALGELRTEAAPDIGDVEVTVKVTFAERT